MRNQFCEPSSFRQGASYAELRSVLRPVAQLSCACSCGCGGGCGCGSGCGCGCSGGCGCSCQPCPPRPCCPNPPCPAYFTITFDANGGVPVPAPQTVPYGGLLARPVDPVRTGYTFAGWYPVPGFSAAPWEFDTDVVTQNMVLQARWLPALYLVSFDTNGGVPIPAPQMVPYGGRVAAPAIPARPGYAFVGWYPTADFSGAPWNFDTGVVTGSLILYARWAPQFFTVTFNANGGMPTPPAQTVEYGGTVTRPTDPVREGYVFVAWYQTPDLTGAPWSFVSNTVTENLTLYARWLEPA